MPFFICNFNIPTLEPKVVVRARVLDEESFKPTGDKTRYYFIQLPQFDKKEEECDNLIDMWIYNLKNMGIRQEVAFMHNNEIFRRLAQVTNVATLTPEERRSYEEDVKNARDTLNQIRGARMEGRAEGRAEERYRISRNLLAMGLKLESISETTGLPIDVIENL